MCRSSFFTRGYRLIFLDGSSVSDAKPNAECVAAEITEICPCPQKAHKVVGQADKRTDLKEGDVNLRRSTKRDSEGATQLKGLVRV